jgi:hypothetical protein
VRRVAFVLSLALGLLVSARLSAHDPLEITSDAHVDERGLNVHTTLSLDSAARICLAGKERTPSAVTKRVERRLGRADFQRFRPAFERCARTFYSITAGGQALGLRSLSLQLSIEDDLELRAVYARPHANPLLFDALGLKGLSKGAGLVLTATGKRSFLGQKLLSPDDTRLELAINDEGEALGTPRLPRFGRSLRRGAEESASTGQLLFLLGLLALSARRHFQTRI